MTERTKKRWYHGISIAFIVVALCFTVFRFQPVFWRLLSALEDFGRSIGYFFAPKLVTPTITDIPDSTVALLPLTWEEFQLCLDKYWRLLIDWKNFLRYIIVVMDIIIDVSSFVGPIAVTFGFVAFLIWILYGIPDKVPNDETKEGETVEESRESKPYKWFMLHVAPRARKVRDWVNGYLEFLSPKGVKWYKKGYKLSLVLIWLYNLNILTICFEVAAFFFYFITAWDLESVYTLVVKVILDLTVALEFLPTIIEVLIGYKIFDWFRIRIGKKLRKNKVKKAEKFLDDYRGSIFAEGKQRSKKSTLLAFFKRIEERRFRKKAFEKMKDREKQFPFFPWATLERTVDRCRDKQFIVLEDIEYCVRYMKRAFDAREDAGKLVGLTSYLRVEYGYDFTDVLRYAENYPMTFDTGTTVVSLFKAIESYMMLCLIYHHPTPLDISNYSIREDYRFKDNGFFRIFDGNLFRDAEESAKLSQFSHNMNYDIFRPGKAFDEETRYDEAVEFGIGVQQEFSKERKNRYSRAQSPKADDREATQDNDGFELDTKMRGHVATIDNVDFWRWFFDDQRANGLGADNKDMATIATIKKSLPGKIILPFFGIDELVYLLVTKLRDGFHWLVRNNKKGKTLLDYFATLAHQPFYHHFERVRRAYTVYPLKLKMSDGNDGEVFDAKLSLDIVEACTYNDIFATDSARVFYKEKHRKAKRGLNKIEQYEGLYPTRRNFKNQRSYWVEDMEAHYGEHSRKVIPKAQRDGGKGARPL